jgi:hypothetical protein
MHVKSVRPVNAWQMSNAHQPQRSHLQYPSPTDHLTLDQATNKAFRTLARLIGFCYIIGLQLLKVIAILKIA